MMQLLQYLVIFLKFLVPSLMLRFPFFGAWTNYALDVIDGDILLELGMSDYLYQTVDKLADYYSYIIMLIIGLRWRIKRLVVVLFIYRTVGQALFFITRNELAFFYFQNFLEPLVMIYTLLLFYKKSSEPKAYALYKKHVVFIWVIIFVYKFWNEWNLHFANIDLSTLILGFSGGN